MSEEFQKKIAEIIDAVTRGESVRDYQSELIRVAALGMELEREPRFQKYRENCSSVFRAVGETDLSSWANELPAPDLIDFMMLATVRLIYFEPPAAGSTVPPMIPGASAADNRFLFVVGCFLAYPKDLYGKITEVATISGGRIACDHELQRRGSRFSDHAVKFLALLCEVAGYSTGEDYVRLVDDLRPGNWRALASQLLIPKSHWREEIDSHIGFILVHEVNDGRKRPLRNAMIEALEGGLDFLSKRVKDKIIDEVRKANAKKRRPEQGFAAFEEPVEVAAPGSAPDEERDRDLEQAIDVAAPELRKEYGPKADVVLKVALRLGEPKFAQEELAREVGMSERQLRTYLERFKANPKPILGVLGMTE